MSVQPVICLKCHPNRCSCKGPSTTVCEHCTDTQLVSVQEQKDGVCSDCAHNRLYTIIDVSVYEDATQDVHVDGIRIAAWVDPKRIDALKEIFLDAVMDQEVVE